MPLWPPTSATLLSRLNSGRDPDAPQMFAELYRPSVYRFARRFGLQHADADDVAQQVIHSVAKCLVEQQRPADRGRFRSWLAQATRNAAINLVTRDLKLRGSGRTSVAEQLQQTPANELDVEQIWREEERLVLYRAAASEVRANCTDAVWQAFEQTAVVGRSAESVASELKVSVGVVYASRSRVLKRIRRAVERLRCGEMPLNDNAGAAGHSSSSPERDD